MLKEKEKIGKSREKASEKAGERQDEGRGRQGKRVGVRIDYEQKERLRRWPESMAARV